MHFYIVHALLYHIILYCKVHALIFQYRIEIWLLSMWGYWTWPTLVLIMACRQFGAKPLPKIMPHYFLWIIGKNLLWDSDQGTMVTLKRVHLEMSPEIVGHILFPIQFHHVCYFASVRRRRNVFGDLARFELLFFLQPCAALSWQKY